MTNKPDLSKVWAENADPTDIKNPDLDEAGKFQKGWLTEIPPHTWFNYIQNNFSAALAHFNEYGVAQWDTDTVYPVGGWARSTVDNEVYVALVAQSGNEPSASPIQWSKYGAEFANQTEVDAGTEAAKAIAPDTLKGNLDARGLWGNAAGGGLIDLDTLLVVGNYSANGTQGNGAALNWPDTGYHSGTPVWFNVTVSGISTRLTQVAQEVFAIGAPTRRRTWTRSRHDTGWEDWVEHVMAGDIGRKNYIINGNFSINQRAFGGGQPAAGVYGYDRWKGDAAGTRIEQVVENSDSINDSFVISWVGGTGTATVNGVSGLNSGDTFTLNTGSDFSVIVPTDATKIQLEKGSYATDFEYRPVAEELALCQRYFYRLKNSVFVANYGSSIFVSNMSHTIPYPVEMRAVPSISNITVSSISGISAHSSTGVGSAGFVGICVGTSSSSITSFDADAEL